ncbi:MAG TPA: UbiA prenyltransferase family protein [Phycisphaerales bacterium]|nr:UbiA prenyltransferase family protein [Phycisphaerales bacterium]
MPEPQPPSSISPSPDPPRLWDFIRLARPWQWAKGAFVLVGPLYGRAFSHNQLLAAAGAFLAFAFASSACYVINDIADRDADLAHPRKRHRPIAAGRVSIGAAYGFFILLVALAIASLLIVPESAPGALNREWLAACVGAYVVNVFAYSLVLKHKMVADVMSLSVGFVLRVLGGCAAVGVEPSSWLLNVTFFLSMFLAFGKRLGERRVMGDDAPAARIVQSKYTDELLRMSVVVTCVATLLTYAAYVVGQEDHYRHGFNILWLTMLPATYGLLRAMVKVETGAFDDPTEMAVRDRPFQVAAAVFAGVTLVLLKWVRKD